MKTPPVFQPLTFEQATARAQTEGRWLLVAATSSQSDVAQMMDKTTWRNEQIVKWFEKNAIGVRVEVDAQPELAARLRIDAAPTVLLFRHGEEKERLEGFLDAPSLLMCLVGLESGTKTVYDQIIRKGGGDFDRDMHARHSFAKSLLHDQSFIKATDHYVWLWRNMERVNPDMRGVRSSFMAREIKELVGVFRPALHQFTELRDETGAAADADPAARDLRLDWITLNDIVGDDDRTLAWFDGVKNSINAEDLERQAGPHLINLLKSRGRWADVGRLCTNPLKELAFHHEIRTHTEMPMLSRLLPKEALAQMEEIVQRQFRKAAAELYSSMQAAGRTADAKAVHEEALRLDPSEGMKQALADSPKRYD